MAYFNYSPKLYDVRQQILDKIGIPDPGCAYFKIGQADHSGLDSHIAIQFSYSDPALKLLHQSFEDYIFSLLQLMPASVDVDFCIIAALDSLFVEFLRARYPEKIKALGIMPSNHAQRIVPQALNHNKYHN